MRDMDMPFGPVVRADVLQNLGSEPGGGSATITLLKIGFVRPDPPNIPEELTQEGRWICMRGAES